MNILCAAGYTYPFFLDVIDKLDNKYRFENVFLVYNKGGKEYARPSRDQKIRYDFFYNKIYNADYAGCPFENEMEPLDSELLNKMAIYEPEVLKMSERVNMVYDSAERRFRNYHSHVRYWNTFLDKAQIDVCLWSEKPHDIFDYIIYRLCQLKGITFIIQETLQVTSCYGIALQTDYEAFDKHILDELKKYFDDSYTLSPYMKNEYALMTGATKSVAPIIVGTKASRLKERINDIRGLKEYDVKAFPRKIHYNFKERHRVKKMIREYEKLAIEPDLTVPYIFFALHYQPEMTTSPTGGWFVHQYLAVEMLSYYAPEGVTIYVKEHPSILRQHRTTIQVEQYYRMNRLPNVKLVKINFSADELVINAKAISAISGSIGYWGMFKLKPYIMFGNMFMKYAPGTFNVRNNDDCENAMKAIFKEGFSFTHKDVKKFLYVMENNSVLLSGSPYEGGLKDINQDDVNSVSGEIIRLIDLERNKK